MATPPFRPALWRARRRVREARRQAGPHWPTAGTRRASTRVPSRRELPGGRRYIVLGHVLSCLCCSPDRRGQGRLQWCCPVEKQRQLRRGCGRTVAVPRVVGLARGTDNL